MTFEQIVAKANAKHDNKYTYLGLEGKTLTINCPLHGTWKALISTHVYEGCKCKKCAYLEKKSNSKTNEQFIAESKEIFGDKYLYDFVHYVNDRTKVTLVCKKHGLFEISPDAHINQKQGCRKCGYENRKIPHKKNTDKFLNQAKSKWNYDYSMTEYVNKDTKIKYRCEKHGIQEQKPNAHLKHGCQFCNGRGISKHSVSSFMAVANKVHNDKYDYSKVQFDRIHDVVTIICPKHGEFRQKATHHINLKNGCPKCAVLTSRGHQEVIDFIKSEYDGLLKINDRTELDGKELDIYLPEFRLGFEYHGTFWHSEKGVGKKFHAQKFLLSKSKGIRLLQIYSSEWGQKQEIVKSKILNCLGKSNKIYARKTGFYNISKHEKQEFLDRNHIQGNDNSAIHYALMFNDEIVSCMTFGKSRFNRKYDYELMRFCNKLNYSVVGGASKLLAQFRRDYPDVSIISYADKRYSNGNLYYQLGFRLDGETKPSFSVVDIKDGIVHNRMGFKKKDMVDFPGYDENLTAYDIMQLNGYERIWDAGQFRFVFPI